MRSVMIRRLAAIGLFALTVTVAVLSAVLVSRQPSIAVVTVAPAALALSVLAGLGLAAAGALAWAEYPGEAFGSLAVLSSLAWFAGWWASPGTRSPIAFTVGLVLAWVWPAVLAHAVLAVLWTRGRGAARNVWALVVAGYLICIGLLGAVPALLGAAGAECPSCPENLVALPGPGALGRAVEATGLALGAVWAIAVAVQASREVRAASPAARLVVLPIAVPGTIALLAFGLDAARSVGRGEIGIDRVDVATWTIAAAALVALAAGSALRVFRARRTRRSVARIVLDLARGGTGLTLDQRLQLLLGDSDLAVGYPVDEDTVVNATGTRFTSALSATRRRTPLVRDGRTIAVLDVAAERAEDADGLRDVVEGAALAIEHERLLALSKARLQRLRASRARVVAANDEERRRLERDLHDGAQQRLAALALSLGLARSHAMADTLTELEAAEREVRAAIAETREIGHGLYPATLADLGLEAAVRALAEESAIPLVVDVMPTDRLPQTVESAAYFVIAEGPRLAGARAASVAGELRDGVMQVRLRLEDATLTADLTELEDRVGALDGVVSATVEGRDVRLEAAIPCVS
jgi:signal transduction histidine kinase